MEEQDDETEFINIQCSLQGFKKSLYKHQMYALRMMETLEDAKCIERPHVKIETRVGIYADYMGYGKTVTMLALIYRNHMSCICYKHDLYTHTSILKVYGAGTIMKKGIEKLKTVQCTLILCPTSVIGQWQEELEATPLRWYCITSKKKVILFDETNVDVVLCSPSFYNALMDRYSNCIWKRLVMDEPCHIKIASMQAIITEFSWFITATPDVLLLSSHHRHSNHYLGTLFSSYMDYQLFQQLVVKNPDEMVRQCCILPKIESFDYACHQPLYTMVRDVLSHHIVHLIENDQIEQAIRCLGGSNTSNLYELVKKEKDEEIYHCQLRIERFQRLEDTDQVQKWSFRFEQLQHEWLVFCQRWKIYQDEQTMCMICMNQISDKSVDVILTKQSHPILLTCCQQIFCGRCVLKWFQCKSTCPLCRKLITPSFLCHLSLSLPCSTIQTTIGIQDKKKTKCQHLISILDHYTEQNPKFLIVSFVKDTLPLIRDTLKEMGLLFVELNGTVAQRSESITKYRQSKEFIILFLTRDVDTVGLHLPETTDLLFFHSISDTIEAQIIGRAYRLGRTDVLRIHRFKVQ